MTPEEPLSELCEICIAIERCRPDTHGWIKNKYNNCAAWFPCNWEYV